MLRDIGVGVAVLVKNDEGKVLLLKRKNVLGNRCWSTPGGHLEKNESIIHCAMRECQEEIGIYIEKFKFLGITNDIHKGEGKHYISIWMEAIIDKTSSIISEEREVDEFKWFRVEDFPYELFLPFKELLQDNYLKSGNIYYPNINL